MEGKVKQYVVFVFIIISVAYGSVLSHADEAKVIAQFSGKEKVKTVLFSTPGPWVILYLAEGPIDIVVRKSDGRFESTAIQNLQAGSRGSALQEKAGTYFLEIDAYRPWHIQIRSVESVAFPNDNIQ